MTVGFDLLDHPADVRFRATGPTLDAAFVAVVRAFAAVAEGSSREAEATPDDGETGSDSHHPVHVESEDREALLFDFLAELILLQELEAVAVVDAANCTVTRTPDGYTLDAAVVCAPIDEPLFDVKSPTYSEMRIETVDGEWVLEATLDI